MCGNRLQRRRLGQGDKRAHGHAQPKCTAPHAPKATRASHALPRGLSLACPPTRCRRRQAGSDARRAAQALAQVGTQHDVYVLQGGFRAWQSQGLPYQAVDDESEFGQVRAGQYQEARGERR